MNPAANDPKLKKACTANDLEILKLLYVEWENRQERLWSLMIKFTTLNLTLIFLPAIAEKFGFNMNLVQIPHYILPTCGLFFAVVGAIIAQAEMFRIIQIKECIKDNANLLSDKFSKAYSNGNRVNVVTPIAVFSIEILSALIMIISLT